MLRKILLFFVFAPFVVYGQGIPDLYREEVDQAYMPVATRNKPTSPAYRLDGSQISIRQVNVNKEGRNVLKDAANEPSLVVDPTNPLRMAIGWRQFDTIASNFRQAGIAFSDDGGNSWNYQIPLEAGSFRSDPVLDYDSEGNFFYNSLTNDNQGFHCKVFKSLPGTEEWDSGIYAYGGDKQWMAIDRSGRGSNGNMYAYWSTNFTSCVGGFTRSLDGGASFEPCEQLPASISRGTLVVSSDGQLYGCGASNSGFGFFKSASPGKSNFIWDYYTYVNLQGIIAAYAGPNPSGLLGQVWIDLDSSDGPNRGNIYILATVNNSFDPSDIFIVRSTDGGLSWSQPIRINDDALGNNWQWFGSLSVAPSGRIDVTWYDTRDNPESLLSRLYYSYSEDGGITWSPNEALSDAFDPHVGWPQQSKIGDYNHQRSDVNGVHLAWAATFNGEQDVYYSYIQPNLMVENFDVNTADSSVYVSPNPFTHSTFFRFDLERICEVQLEILDARGLPVELIKMKNPSSGKQQIEWLGDGGSGLYFYTLRSDGRVIGRGKMVKI